MSLTSTTHPIHVSFVPAKHLRGKGRLGFTLAPGRKGPGTAGMHDRNLRMDLDRLARTFAVTNLVSLVGADEAKKRTGVTPEEERRGAQARRMTFKHVPIPEGQIPNLDTLVDLVQELRDDVVMGRVVVVHDRAGGGRAASVVTAVLASLGHEVDAAIDIVRSVRAGAVDTNQAAALRSVATTLRQRATPIFDIVQQAFEQEGWKSAKRIAGTTVLQCKFRSNRVAVPIEVVVNERRSEVLVLGSILSSVGRDHRDQVGRLVHRVNWRGSGVPLDFDVTDGEVRAKHVIDPHVAMPNAATIVRAVERVIAHVAQYQPVFEAVSTGRVGADEAIGFDFGES